MWTLKKIDVKKQDFILVKQWFALVNKLASCAHSVSYDRKKYYFFEHDICIFLIFTLTGILL